MNFILFILLSNMSPSHMVVDDEVEKSEIFQTQLYEVPYGYEPSGDLQGSVVLTFDDGPDKKGYTDAILDILKHEKVTATFFINSRRDGWDITKDSFACRTVKRILEEGHSLGNHTASHTDLKDLSANEVKNELDAVEQAVQQIIGDKMFFLRLSRAPYGRPFYEDNRQINYHENFERVAHVFSTRTMHIGWNIDTLDWMEQTPDYLLQNLLYQLDGSDGKPGKRGVILFHSTEEKTVKILPRLLEILRQRHIAVVGIEDYVKAIYGVRSEELFAHAGIDTMCYLNRKK